MKKFFTVFLSIIMILIILSLAAFSVFAFISKRDNGTLSIGDNSLYIAKNVSETSILVEDSLIISKKSNVSDIKNGDYLLFSNGEATSVRYVVDFITSGEPSFILSNGTTSEDIVVPASMIYGKIIYTSTFLGAVIVFASSTLGIAIIGVSTLIIILLLILLTTKKGSGAKKAQTIEGALDKLTNEKKKETTDDEKEVDLNTSKVDFDGTIMIDRKDLEGDPTDMIANILGRPSGSTIGNVSSKTSKIAVADKSTTEESDETADIKEEIIKEEKAKESSTQAESKPSKAEPGNLSAEDILKDLDGLL